VHNFSPSPRKEGRKKKENNSSYLRLGKEQASSAAILLEEENHDDWGREEKRKGDSVLPSCSTEGRKKKKNWGLWLRASISKSQCILY